jgi:hypothetical protein
VLEVFRRANLGRPLSEDRQQKISEAHRRRGTRPPNAAKPWTAAEDVLLGTMPDERVAEQFGRMAEAVRNRRCVFNVGGFYWMGKRKSRRCQARLARM